MLSWVEEEVARMKILALSDRVDRALWSESGIERVPDVGLILACGDLPYDYLEYVVTLIGAPFFYVLGNHDRPMLRASGAITAEPEGGINIGGKVRAVRVDHQALVIAGLQGTRRCSLENGGVNELAMLGRAARMVPRLLWNRLRYGRYLDVLISHAPPARIHEGEDPCHRGFRTLRWMIRWFRPRLALHGHIHPSYGVDVRPTALGPTRILNIYGAIVLEVDHARS